MMMRSKSSPKDPVTGTAMLPAGQRLSIGKSVFEGKVNKIDPTFSRAWTTASC